MRLDKYLKVSRLIKRRTVANDACDAGRVMAHSIRGHSSKSSIRVRLIQNLKLSTSSITHIWKRISNITCHIKTDGIYFARLFLL